MKIILTFFVAHFCGHSDFRFFGLIDQIATPVVKSYVRSGQNCELLLCQFKHLEKVFLPGVCFVCVLEPHKYQLRVYLFQGRDLLPSDPDGLSGTFEN